MRGYTACMVQGLHPHLLINFTFQDPIYFKKDAGMNAASYAVHSIISALDLSKII